MEHTSRKYIKSLLSRRPREAHKGTFGKVLIIGGSKGMTGAAVLAAKAALRSGAGLVRVCIDQEFFPIIQTNVIEATCVPRNLGPSILEEYDSIVIGPGLGTENEGAFAVAKVMQNYNGKIVMDADALNIVAENEVNLKKTDGQIIITPHLGEAARLIDSSVEEIAESREKTATFIARATDTVTVLKGHDTIIALPEKDDEQGEPILPQFFVNTTGNPGMATGGSGDVLSGIIGGLLAQGMSREDAAIAGVYIHGLAGDLAAEELGEYGLIAGDIAKYVAYAILDIQKGGC